MRCTPEQRGRPGRVNDAYVRARAVGSPINPMSFSARFRTNSPIGYHGLRHRHASLHLADGASFDELSSRLGHTDTAMTLSVHASFYPALMKMRCSASTICYRVANGWQISHDRLIFELRWIFEVRPTARKTISYG
jgi:hypothetical protein